GRASEGNLYFTVFNYGKERERFRLAFDLKALGLKGKIKVREMLSGQDIPVSLEKDKMMIEGELDSEDVWLLKIH
ncbi:MAG: hypothetical protein ACPL7E_04525, partial [bacterium]